MPLIGAVVVHYSRPDLTDTCVESLLREVSHCARSGQNVEIVVVDNSGTYRRPVADSRGRLRIIRPRSNLGYAGGIALGTTALRDADYYFLLNNDVEVLRGTICALLRAHEYLPNVGALQPLVLNQDGSCCDSIGSTASPFLYGYGYYDSWLGRIRSVSVGELKALEVFGVDGMAIFVSGANWRRYGWDPEFFMFNEDGLLTLRLKLAGLSNYVVLDAKVKHLRGASAEGRGLKRNPIFPSYYITRNRWLSMLYLYSASELLEYLPLSVLFELAKSIYLSAHLKRPLHSYYSIMALWYILKEGHRIRRLRRSMVARRKVTVQELVRSGGMIPAGKGIGKIVHDLISGGPK